MSLHEEIKECESAISHLKQKMEDLKKSANYCRKCEMYYPKEQAKQTTSTKEGTGCDPDCGYGDDDILYDCTYVITYDVCPLCGGLNEVNSYETNVRNRHYRWQTRREVWV